MDWMPVITTTNPISGREYRLRDARDVELFLHYGQKEGSGFGYLSWKCQRPVGYDWPDIGAAFPIVFRKGPFRVLFSGQIVRLNEQAMSGIEVHSLGWVHVATADTFNQIYCDTRLDRWRSSEEPSGAFRPDLFDWQASEGIYMKPRRGVDYEENDYTYVRYTFPFGEVAARIVADFDVALDGPWPGKLEIRDSNGVVLWDKAVTDSGSIDEETTGSPTHFEVRFYCTAAGENTAADDTIYGELVNVKVFSVTDNPLDMKVIADDMVAAVLSVAGHGLSADTTLIEAPGLSLEPSAFDTDMTPADVLAWCAQYGDIDGSALAWGVSFDDERRLFLEPVDITTIQYVVDKKRAELSRAGDWSESHQKVYGVYTDENGEMHRSTEQVDSAVIDSLGGYYRRTAVQLSGMTDVDLIDGAAAIWLSENKNPKPSGSFVVRGSVQKPSGLPIPFDEIVPIGLVQVREWRAREATLSANDYRDNVTTFPLAGVRISFSDRTAELIPSESSDTFARYMAIISNLLGKPGSP